MLIGVDWGGTKIEIVALTPDGQEHLRSRQATPRGDYDDCLRVIADLVDRAEAEVGTIDRVGIGIPGSVFITPIVKARHGDSSGVRGAAWLWAED